MTRAAWNPRWVKAERVLRGLTQAKLAKMARVTMYAVRQSETSGDARVDDLAAILGAMDLTIPELMGKYATR